MILRSSLIYLNVYRIIYVGNNDMLYLRVIEGYIFEDQCLIKKFFHFFYFFKLYIHL